MTIPVVVRRQSLFLLVSLFCLVRSETSTVSYQPLVEVEAEAGERERNLAVYALYNLPSFAVTFRTAPTEDLAAAIEAATGGDSTPSSTTTSSSSNNMNKKNNSNKKVLISETNGIYSSLSFPMRTITQALLMEKLQAYIKESQTTQTPSNNSNNNINGHLVFYEIYNHFVGLDLLTKWYFVEGADGMEDDERRRLRLGVSTSSGIGVNSASGEESSYSSRDLLSSHVTIVADMFPTAAFEEPLDASTKPSNQQVQDLFGQWIDEIFQNHRDQYLRELVQSDQELLREISSLVVETDTAHHTNGSSSSSSSSSSKYASSWGQRTENALFTILILFSVFGLLWMLLYLRQRFRRHKRLYNSYDEDGENDGSDSGSDIPVSEEEFDHENSGRRPRRDSMDAVRHGDDVFHRSSVQGAHSVLENADRYLSKHRPDWINSSNNNNNNTNSDTAGPFQALRNYSIPANPFEYIYSAFTSEPPRHDPRDTLGALSPSHGNSAFEPHRRRPTFVKQKSALDIQKENMAAAFDDDSDGDHGTNNLDIMQPRTPTGSVGRHWNDGGGYRPISSIWRNITTFWDENVVSRSTKTVDGIMLASNPESMDSFYRDDGCNTEEYEFAFKDFPRHDGTPCLIFNEDTSEQQRMFEIGSPSRPEDETLDEIDLTSSTPVSDSVFIRMLSQKSLNCSFDDLNHNTENNKTDMPARSPEFKAKLGRLMQQKHRQYEKKAIVEKHQRKRAKERKMEREHERRERHKMMEKEIEEIEASFQTPLERTSRVMQQMSPKRNYSPMPLHHLQRGGGSTVVQKSPKPNYSPMVRHSYRQAFSPYKNSGLSPLPPSSSSSHHHHPISRASPIHGNGASGNNKKIPSSSNHSSSNGAGGIGGSAIFRPKTSYGNFGGSVEQSLSSRSVSPPGGLDEDNGLPDFHVRPRTSQQPFYSSSELYVDTSYGPHIDHSTLDKLSMPPMTVSRNDMREPKYPSPNSVMDDMFNGPNNTSRRKTFQKQRSHRRVNSEDPELIEPKGKINNNNSNNNNFNNSFSNLPRQQARIVHRRSNSNSSGAHRQTGSNSEDVFLHGIIAQTRFV